MEVSNELPFKTRPLSPKSQTALSKAVALERSATNTSILAQFQRSLSDAAELFEHLNADYAQEKANGVEIRSCLENQYIQLREREDAVKAMQEDVDRDREALYLQRRTQEADFDARSNDLEQQGKTFMSRLRDELTEELVKREAALEFGQHLTEQRVHDAELKATDLKTRLSVAIAEKNELQRDQGVLRAELRKKDEDFDAAKQELLTLQTQHSACSTEKRELTEALASSNIELIQTQKRLDDARTRISQLKEVISEFMEYLKSRTQSNQLLRAAVQLHLKQILTVAVESDNLVRDLKTKIQKLVKLVEDALAALQSQETQHQDALNGHRAEISSLKESLNASKLKITELAQTIAERDRQYTELELRHRSLTTEYQPPHPPPQATATDRELAPDMKREMDRLRRTLKTVEAENERLRSDVTKAAGREHVGLQAATPVRPAEISQIETPQTPPSVPEQLPTQLPTPSSSPCVSPNQRQKIPLSRGVEAPKKATTENPGPSTTRPTETEQTRRPNQNQQLKRKGAPGATDWGSYKIPRKS
ncbi:hypothetical protein R3P38DRAFT_1774239 [Favolaschia claudopus]|uniref:Uncharacterized protein n=1 Tax=Favolaschia claudopus TaxID=2862362 RepID=A0AAW0A736_9AGAR